MATPPGTRPTFVIIGAGLAGAKAAETLRAEGFDGRVVLIGEEPERPYERPPLSKGYLRGEADREKTFVHDESFYADQRIELRTATEVRSIHPDRHTVALGGGEELTYDRLLLATGAAARQLQVPGAELPGVHTLRSLADADVLARSLERADSVVVIGAGWIGTEVAASARQLGHHVAMVAPGAVPLERVLGAEVGDIYRTLHADHGVDLYLQNGVDSIHGGERVDAVHLTDGSRLSADLVVVAVGATPRVGLARDAGLEVGDGIVVDSHLRTNAPDVFAAGDAATAFHPDLDTHIRVEHWANALHQGPAAARNMLGIATPYTRIPYFFSDQYELGMEYSGYAPAWDRVVFRGDPAAGAFIAFWLANDVVVAGMNVNLWDVNEQIQQLIRDRSVLSPDRLADIGTPLDELATQSPTTR
jgi:3-phenylpropionate/trans-cinnamate dioxygenase ferredoxin reductase subunit